MCVIGKGEEDQKTDNTYFTTLALEDFFIRFAEEQLLNSTFFEFSAKDNHNVGEWKCLVGSILRKKKTLYIE